MINGQQLYEAYAECQLALNNCGVDTWEDLHYQERLVWDATALMLRNAM